MIKWFKRHKKTLLVLAALTCPPAAVYIQGADVVIDAVEVLTEPEPEQVN